MRRIRFLGGLYHAGAAILCIGLAVNSLRVWADTSTQATATGSGNPATSTVAVTKETAQGEPIFAVVNGKAITVREFKGLLAETMRQRYYHGTIPEDKAEALYKEIADLAIDRELLVAEAEKRGIKPDPAKFEKTMADLDKRYAADPMWKDQRDKLSVQIKRNMERQSLMEQFEKTVRDVPPPPATEVRAFYDSRPDLFTEPERLRLSIILLKVDPGAAKEAWDRTRDEGQKLFRRIKEGADFAELARLHSQHSSADAGGDMGYLHGGMLPRGMEDKVGTFEIGVVNEPVTALEGIILTRVEDRVLPKLREFSAVEKRAQDLLMRDRGEEAWKKTISQLHVGAKIQIMTPQQPDSSNDGFPAN